MKGYLITVFWGLLVWFCATMFFVLLGEHVLFSPGTDAFIISTLLLIIGTAFLLYGVTYVYLKFNQSKHAPLKFGIIGTIVGLSLDTITLSNHHLVFPKLDDSQIIAFTAWMTFAYALYLIIPALINQQRNKRRKQQIDL
ncbi:DUF5367 family protein [Bacillus litorisediminis]|uniref:DUF5367 family protein n=1 Tax=Bacillus litorisediminis TaxID=2922713 RepID=UPI001FAFDBB5|nr:DUF5367 family protein [Bacillus litorisediminis]